MELSISGFGIKIDLGHGGVSLGEASVKSPAVAPKPPAPTGSPEGFKKIVKTAPKGAGDEVPADKVRIRSADGSHVDVDKTEFIQNGEKYGCFGGKKSRAVIAMQSDPKDRTLDWPAPKKAEPKPEFESDLFLEVGNYTDKFNIKAFEKRLPAWEKAAKACGLPPETVDKKKKDVYAAMYQGYLRHTYGGIESSGADGLMDKREDGKRYAKKAGISEAKVASDWDKLQNYASDKDPVGYRVLVAQYNWGRMTETASKAIDGAAEYVSGSWESAKDGVRSAEKWLLG